MSRQFSFLFVLGDAVSCHVCNSKYDPGCDDPMKSDKYLRDCDTQPGTYGVNGTVETGFVKCRKMKQDRKFILNVDDKVMIFFTLFGLIISYDPPEKEIVLLGKIFFRMITEIGCDTQLWDRL